MIVCITGMPGAGKSVVADILKSKGYTIYELGDIVREEMKKRGIERTSENEKNFAIYLRKKFGKEVATRLTLKKAKIKSDSRVAIVGFRSTADLNYVKKRFSVVTIAVVAPTTTRFSRTKKRKRPQDPKTMKEFIEHREKREARFGILSVIKNADYVISNTGTLADLNRSVLSVARDAGIF